MAPAAIGKLEVSQTAVVRVCLINTSTRTLNTPRTGSDSFSVPPFGERDYLVSDVDSSQGGFLFALSSGHCWRRSWGREREAQQPTANVLSRVKLGVARGAVGGTLELEVVSACVARARRCSVRSATDCDSQGLRSRGRPESHASTVTLPQDWTVSSIGVSFRCSAISEAVITYPHHN